MNFAWVLTTQLLLSQADPVASAQTEAEVLEEIRDRLAAIEARLEALEQDESATEDEVTAEIEALREEAAALQESAQAPADAADSQRQGLQLRQAAVQNALEAVREAYQVIDTGEEDASGTLGRAYDAFEEAWLLATEVGSEAEAEEFRQAMEALSLVSPALGERDFSAAKALLDRSALHGMQGLRVAESTAVLPLSP